MAQKTENQAEEKGDQEVASSLSRLLAECPVWVTYVPIQAEVVFRDFFEPRAETAVYEIAPMASLDPFEEASKVVVFTSGRTACVLIPGRAFDSFGTRHGQGGGWYDRFLATLPNKWIRVGFCNDEQFSHNRLLRKSWDEPVDYVCVVGKDTASVIKTNARKVL